VASLKAWKLQSHFKTPDELIFPNNAGRFIGHDNVIKRHFHPLFRKLDVACLADPARPRVPPFNWHALRHFAVSCWIEAGLSPKTVQTFAGHASLQITMDRYGHLFPREDYQTTMDRIALGFSNDLMTSSAPP
jgi:integrase